MNATLTACCTLLVASCLSSALSAEESPAAIAARKLIAEFQNSDTNTARERTQLADAYNELGEDQKALNIYSTIPEEWLAKNQGIGRKLDYYLNIRNEPDANAYHVQYLAFIQRCLDRKVGNRRELLVHKASLLCRTSGAVYPQNRFRIENREQYEDAFRTFRMALWLSKTRSPTTSSVQLMTEGFHSREFFPGMHAEPRFKTLALIVRDSE